MDIAALSMQMSSSQVQQAASISVLKKSMDNAESNAAAILQMMPAPANGHKLDVRA